MWYLPLLEKNLIPDWLIRTGIRRLLAERIKQEDRKFNDDERAQKILEFVIKNYPSHPLTPEVEEYLKIIKNLSEN